MICDICKINQAGISVEQISSHSIKHIYLCSLCAEKLGFGNFSENIDISITNLSEKNTETNYDEQKECPHCGRTLDLIRKTKRIGCENCFSYFKNEIKSIVKAENKIFDYTSGIYQNVETKLAKQNSITVLRKKLKEAIDKEEYEQAALLRDELLKLETENDI